ncbi:MAG: bifunctional tetrahydrofolate synthase/dihydrofolate synthase [SAR86 cluster bacterium]|uniref:Dihydrofolate synthase/folylpolyglutamate synthase n=1 Tax=SAR86 cluster bacterium TaxID=2030880 RepID=A0A2A4X153_9GAMM|nr:MAG: bifunctional tetrahydrofolate synthase/dihydrofolate synthase [SAR86 cluster bacterium]
MPAKGSSLENWLQYISSVHPREIELGLGRTQRVAASLGLGKPAPLVVTVAGTNGKGSCVATMEAILQQAGFKTGCYTSPHIHAFNERIRINASNVTDESLITAFEAIDEARSEETLSYFEFATLAGLYLIRENNADVALLEVGLGGRLDAVNIVDADVAVISSVGIDHTDWLGNDIESIAAEKAGIMRANSPTVFGGEHLPSAIIQRALELGSPLIKIGHDYHAEEDAANATWRWRGQGREAAAVNWPDLPIPSLMLSNVAASLQALMLLPISLEIESVAAALDGLALAGRFDKRKDLSNGRTVIFDVAHNLDAMQQLAIRLQGYKAQNQGAGRITAVLAVMADKDVIGMITALEYCVDIWYIAQVDEARSMAADEVAQTMKGVGIASDQGHILQFDSVESAYRAACDQTEAEDTVLVTGSFFTVAAVHGLTEQA